MNVVLQDSNYTPSPDEIAVEFVTSDVERQSEILYALGIRSWQLRDPIQQIQNFADELNHYDDAQIVKKMVGELERRLK